MVEGRRLDAWEHTSWLIASFINSNPFRKKGARPIKPSEVNPMERKERTGPSIKIKISALKGMFER